MNAAQDAGPVERTERKQIGYASYSKREKTALEMQVAALTSAGCKTVRTELVQGPGQRKALTVLLDHLLENEVLMVTKLDRLAGSVEGVISIVETLHAKGVGLQILSLDLDTTTLAGAQMLQVLRAATELDATREDKREEKLKVDLEASRQQQIAKVAHRINRYELALVHLDVVAALHAKGKDSKKIARGWASARALQLKLCESCAAAKKVTPTARASRFLSHPFARSSQVCRGTRTASI